MERWAVDPEQCSAWLAADSAAGGSAVRILGFSSSGGVDVENMNDIVQVVSMARESGLSYGYQVLALERSKKETVRQCRNCGKRIPWNARKDKLFCDSECRILFNQKKRTEKARIQRGKRFCSVCGKEILKPRSKYCSEFCRNKKRSLGRPSGMSANKNTLLL